MTIFVDADPGMVEYALVPSTQPTSGIERSAGPPPDGTSSAPALHSAPEPTTSRTVRAVRAGSDGDGSAFATNGAQLICPVRRGLRERSSTGVTGESPFAAALDREIDRRIATLNEAGEKEGDR
jgi:hypothetical protein